MGSDNKGIVTTGEDFAPRLSKFRDSIKSVRKWSPRKKTLSGTSALLLVALLVWAIAAVLSKSKSVPASSGILTSSQAIEAAGKALQKKDYASAEIDLTDKVANPDDMNTLTLLATTYMDEKKYQDALSTLQKVKSLYGIHYGLAIMLGQTEALLNNNPAAIQYYQQAITLLKQAKPGSIANADKQEQSLQAVIKSLQ